MRVRMGLCVLALLASGCGAAEVISEGISGNTASQSPSRGQTSLQTAPFDSAGVPTHVSPAPAPAPQPPQDGAPDFTSIAANFDPAKQRFIWVLPPGVHGEEPWGFKVVVRHKGNVKYEGELPLSDDRELQAGSRPEFPAGYEIIRLSDDGLWHQRTAALDNIILGIIEQYGRGDGEVEFNSQLHLSLDPAARKLYCDEGKVADIRLYVEEEGKPLLPMLDVAGEAFSRIAIMQGCQG